MLSDRHGRGLLDDSEYALAAALVELLARSPAAVARLRDLASVHEQVAPIAPAYTVASLARVVGVSPRAVRGAIARGELVAAKRGGRWIISDDAVRTWARAESDTELDHGLRRPRDRRLPTDAVALLERGANGSRPAL